MAVIPAELKAISPYLARANELEKAEPVISYWCTYYALQQAMSIGSKDSESQVYLFELMDKLESTKAAHASEDAFTDDVAAAAYIENFGLKLFSQADNEDRKAKATRLTARKFLAAANFLELLAIFGEVAAENRDRIKYAKWKAADIAKAFREGRTPTPGPAGGLQEDEEDAADPSQVTEVTAAEAKELSKEFEALDTGSQREETAASEAPAQDSPSFSPVAAVRDDATSFDFPQQPNTEPSAPADEVPDFVDDESDFDPASLVPAPSADPAREESTADSISAEIAPTSHQTAELPLPHAHLPSEPPAFPSAVFPSAPPSLPSSPPSVPTYPSASTNSSTVPAASAPPAPARPAAPTAPPAAAPPVLARRPDTFDPMTVGDVQKHARWAISALNYEDFETARKELRLALAILGE